jgi:hypothetical protein
MRGFMAAMMPTENAAERRMNFDVKSFGNNY